MRTKTIAKVMQIIMQIILFVCLMYLLVVSTGAVIAGVIIMFVTISLEASAHNLKRLEEREKE